MKRIVCILLVLLTVIFNSCGKENVDNTDSEKAVSTAKTTAETATVTTPLTTVQDDIEVLVNDSQSALDIYSMMYYTGTKQEMYISDYLANYELSVMKYSVIDLDGDSNSETVLWLAKGTYEYYGFLILHENGDSFYGYELTYRAFYELKEDGTFSFSAGASDHGIGKIEFTNDTYSIKKIAYCESDCMSQKVSYYIENEAVSHEEFEQYITEHDQKQNTKWHEVEKEKIDTTDSIDDIMETTEKTSEPFTETTDATEAKPSIFPEGFVFPKTDGSTSTTNLDNAIRNAILGGEQKVSHTKTYTSFENLLSGNCELIFTTPLSDAQLKRMAEVGFKHEAEPVAGEGFVFVVNKDNPVDTLTVEQLKGIYSGEITNWSEVGGNDAEIVAYQRNNDSGSQNYMISFMGDIPLMKPVTDVIPATMTGILDVVANYNNGINAIGYSVYAFSDGMYENISEIKYIKVNGVEPSLKTLADGSYPLLGYNYAVFSADEAEDSPVRTLVKWIQSDEGQQVVADAGYIPYRSVDGLTLPEATTKTLYSTAATSGISKPEETADYYYVCRRNVDNFTAVGLSEKVQSFIDEATNELSKVDKEKMREFIKTRDMLPYTQDIITYKELINGYLSVTVGLVYYDGTQEANEFFYDVRTAVFDIYTGEKLELSDLFFDGVDFVPLLNSTLAKEASAPYSSFGATYDMISDFSGLYNGDFAFTADSIIFSPGTYFADGVKLSIADLSEYMVTSIPRDMAGCIDDSIPIYKVIRTRISDDIGYAEVKNGITIWYLDSEKSGIPAESCDKVNAFINQIYETYFTEEKLLKFVKSKGVNAETVSVGPWPDFRITVVGNRYVMLNGANLVFASVGDKYYEFSVIEEHYNSYYFYYYFNAETGEKLQVSDLFADGWENDAEYFALDDDFSETNENVISQGDLTDCSIVNIRNYTDPSHNKGDLSDLEWPVSVYAVTKTGEKVLVCVLREYIK